MPTQHETHSLVTAHYSTPSNANLSLCSFACTPGHLVARTLLPVLCAVRCDQELALGSRCGAHGLSSPGTLQKQLSLPGTPVPLPGRIIHVQGYDVMQGRGSPPRSWEMTSTKKHVRERGWRHRGKGKFLALWNCIIKRKIIYHFRGFLAPK